MEAWEHFVSDELVQLEQGWAQRGSSTWPFLLERYVNGEVGLGVDLSARLGPRKPSYYRAVVKRAESHGVAGHPVPIACADEQGTGYDGEDGMRSAVLVGGVEPVKHVEGMAVDGIRSSVWLQSFDQPPCRWGQPFDLPLTLSELARGTADNELGAVRGRMLVEAGEVPSNVVERRSHAMDAVTRHETKPRGRWLADSHPPDAVAALRIFLSDRTIRVTAQEVVDISFESIQVTQGPLEPEIGISERVHDGLGLTDQVRPAVGVGTP